MSIEDEFLKLPFVPSVSEYELTEINNFGVGCEKLNNAAMFAAKFMILDYGLAPKTPLPDVDEGISVFDSSKDSYFEHEADLFLKHIIRAIDKSELEVELIRYNIDGSIDCDRTYVDMYLLKDWLRKFGFEGGDFWAEYEDYVVELHSAATDAVEKLRNTRGKTLEKSITKEQMLERLIAYSTEIENLRNELRSLHEIQEMNRPISIRQENTYLNIIGALLDLLVGKNASGKPYSQFESQSAIIEMINIIHGENGGLSKRNLEGKFAIARRALNSRK